MKNITIRHGCPKAPGYHLDVRARTEQVYGSLDPDIHASLFVFDTEPTRNLLVQVNGLVLSELPNRELIHESMSERGLCYKITYEPCLDLLMYQQYAEILQYPCPEITKEPQIESLERAAFAHIQKTLATLTAEEIEGFAPHLQKLHRVLSSLLVEGHHGRLPFQTQCWLSCDGAQQDDFLEALAANDNAGRLVCSMGRNLTSIFREEVEPLSIMLQDNMLGTYYRNHDLMNLGYEFGASMIGKLAHQMPSMKIIELGAGTGGATMSILKELGKRFVHYDFTDISTGFFESAKEEQNEWADRLSKPCQSTPALLLQPASASCPKHCISPTSSAETF